ncbi:phenylalanine--tRNA ligase subunit beta [Candidatus Saccharibacteria bacterium oral taxon 488]|nr:phenylalanine--tRNA ligase subunit beta [Candidatus Saccharibacteria bacterium oral taxon 488]
MKVSLNLIKQLINFELPPVDELVARVNQQLGGVEEVIDLSAKYGGARIVRVVECAKHPDADRLSVTKIDDGGAVADVPRDEDGLVQVVCGAPNVHADMWAIWLPPKSTVPASFNDDEPFVLDARPLRGVLSQGMLAAADELAIGTDHEGIVEIYEHDVPVGVELTAGANFAETFGLDDYVLDIENKMFTHRPDCFGQLGVAREIAGIFHQQFTSPEWYKSDQQFAAGEGLELTVANDAPELVPRFMAVAFRDVTVQPSPLWLQCQLVAMGGKPINNVVDATNYMMFMTAQPTHAYDYDKLRGHKLEARMARDGEKVSLLNGKEYKLTNDDIVIADGEGVIGLAGIMGGADTEVSNGTKNIILECANFDMYALRRTAMRHGIFTDALTRFNKGQSPLQNAAVLKQLMSMVGGAQASEVFDASSSNECIMPDAIHRVDSQGVSNEFVNERLGTDFSNDEIADILRRTEFMVEVDEHGCEVYSPFWRTDIELPEDIVEEVGRLYGFDKLPRQLPRRSIKPAPKNLRRELKNAVRQSLSRAGANEVLTYSFVHERILKNAEQDVAQAYKLSNALSPDLQYYRLAVLPSLLDKVHANIKAGHDEFALFEMGKGHSKMHGLGEDNLPVASQFTDIVYAAKKPGAGAPFYVIRRLVEQLARELGAELVFKPIEEELNYPVTAPFDQSRSALVETTDGTFIGLVGELKQSVIKNFKLPVYVAAASLDTAGLEAVYAKRDSHYQPLSRYPSTTRDISLKVPSAVKYQQLLQTLDEVVRDVAMEVRLELLTIYQPEDDAEQKTMTWRLTFTSHERTLADKDIAPVMQQIERAAKDKWGAEIV